jgi:hypothetical protein
MRAASFRAITFGVAASLAQRQSCVKYHKISAVHLGIGEATEYAAFYVPPASFFLRSARHLEGLCSRMPI